MEKNKQISLDQTAIASFQNVIDLYKEEKDSILKTTPLTQAAVLPSKLQLQNVQHVLKVFNDKVFGALTLKGKNGTASFIQTVINWWNVMNVSSKGQDQRLSDPYRAVQNQESTSLDTFIEIFSNATFVKASDPRRRAVKFVVHKCQFRLNIER